MCLSSHPWEEGHTFRLYDPIYPASGRGVSGTDSGEMQDCQGTWSRAYRDGYTIPRQGTAYDAVRPCSQRCEAPAPGFLASAVRSRSNRPKAF